MSIELRNLSSKRTLAVLPILLLALLASAGSLVTALSGHVLEKDIVPLATEQRVQAISSGAFFDDAPNAILILQEVAVIPLVTATPAPKVVVTATSTVVSAIRVLPDKEALYRLVASYFPEQPDFAWKVTICESQATPDLNTGNGHYGMWQFNLGTWRGVGGVGLPSDASAEEQTMRARLLHSGWTDSNGVFQKGRGWQPWACA